MICGEDNTSGERQRGERLTSKHAGRDSWCNADGIAMETNGGKAQTRRRGLNKKEEISASHHWEAGELMEVVLLRGEGPPDK